MHSNENTEKNDEAQKNQDDKTGSLIKLGNFVQTSKLGTWPKLWFSHCVVLQ